MIAALADAGAALERADYPRRGPSAARGASCCATLRDERRPPAAHATTAAARKIGAYLEDHAFLLEALLALYEATFEPRWFDAARALADDADRALRRPRARRLLLDRRRRRAARRAPQGPRGRADPRRRLGGRVRPAAAGGADRRARATSERASARCACCTRSRRAIRSAFGHLLQAMDFHLSPVREVALVGDDTAALETRRTRALSPPRRARRRAPARDVPLLAGRTPVEGRAAAYVCESFACRQPVTEPEQLAALLG